jgi:C_GCAxxG_C_C family probable redox protein
VIKILGEDLNYDPDQAAKMATPFGGGVSRWGTICGAFVGGAMALGFRYGRTKPEEKDKRDRTYQKVQEFLGAVEKEFGTLQCRELIKLNLRDPADQKRFQELKMQELCARLVAASVDQVRRLLK